MADLPAWLAEIRFDEQGLIPAIAQDQATGKILMVAWMNQESLQETVGTGRAVYWSRSRQRLWRKGEESGHIQKLHDIQLDCDGDAIVLLVEQLGGIACHTGRQSCFYRSLQDGQWKTTGQILKDPADIYQGTKA